MTTNNMVNNNPLILSNQIYVSQASGNDSNSGSFSAPLATFGAAITLANTFSPPLVIICLDQETYDEQLTISSSITIYAPYATFSCTTGDAFTFNSYGITVTFSTLQSTAGNAVTNTFGYPQITFLASFSGNFVNNAENGHTMFITAQTIVGSVINSIGSPNNYTVLSLASPIGGSTDANTFAPWSNTLVPFTA